MTLVIMIALWIVLGLIGGMAAGSIWKGERPIGERNDYILAVVFAVITGLIDWFVLPLMGITGAFKFATLVIEPFLGGLVALWVVRLLKKK